MLPKEKMARINELAKKAKEQKLTEAEAKEQTTLRAEYLQAFRATMTQTIENVRVYDAEGDDVTPDKLKKIQENKRLH
ncbi:DUF896 domain-containing protein [Lederbergia lenta]|uniref:UPF0291 protein NCTC4824_02428 n=1 Tax=Lederbergia lenta TaxID=1467 RepID=A0A2X4W4S5_LEDLE|nr:DUF896 domain-containing protein [Lederbergia lenta]MCM3109737.1 DUF896 domain-containing protein [Lederbergia lenta]MEC2324512.1 DUF896 domain-containing protein [Lederbergia lenta]SQI59637.1 UPF0291 protein [Lederbergia lenta]